MVTMGVFPFQGKTHMVEPEIEPGTSWLVVGRSDHQATRLVTMGKIVQCLRRGWQTQGLWALDNGKDKWLCIDRAYCNVQEVASHNRIV